MSNNKELVQSMFCENCGTKLKNNAKFCSNCGAKIDVNLMPEKEQPLILKPAISMHEFLNSVASDYSEDKTALLMKKYFGDYQKYGDKVLFLEEETYISELELNKARKMVGGDKPLMIFRYDRNFTEGFVVTANTIAFCYNSFGENRKKLKNIRDVKLKKIALSDAITLITLDNTELPPLLITGLLKEWEFVQCFSNFLFEINKQDVYYKENFKLSNGQLDMASLLKMLCEPYVGEYMYCDIGTPISQQCKKYFWAIENYGIDPMINNVYLIYDETSKCKKGFAICNTGIYYNQKDAGYISWEEFKHMRVELGFMCLNIGQLSFGADKKSGYAVLSLLEKIQKIIN